MLDQRGFGRTGRAQRVAVATMPDGPWQSLLRHLDIAASIAAAGAITVLMAGTLAADAPAEEVSAGAGPSSAAMSDAARTRPGRMALVAGYVSQPMYQRSDVHLTRRDGTDVTLQSLGWDGDALMPPIDGGIRSVEWWGPFGVMIDFLHNKAVARLGKGAHGREISDPVVDVVSATGTLAGRPVPPQVTLTDVFKRLEFTHGHNVLLLTPLLKLGAFGRIRPYVGAGAGVAVPHVEVWFPDDPVEVRTSEYQYVGAAVQCVAGIEVRLGTFGAFIEYKASHAWVKAALTGGKSWKNFNLPGDLVRQLQAWWAGAEPPIGRLETQLTAHQIAAGGGYWLTLRKAAPTP